MDKYNSFIAKLFRPWNKRTPWAVTLGQTSYFSCEESWVSQSWYKHEDCHKRQWKKDGKFKFIRRYLWQGITKGYWNIDYEIAARLAETQGTYGTGGQDE